MKKHVFQFVGIMGDMENRKGEQEKKLHQIDHYYQKVSK